MKNVIFVAPYFMAATERFLGAVTTVTDARVSLVSCDPLEKLSPDIRQRLNTHHQIKGISTDDIVGGVRSLQDRLGPVDRLLGMLEQIQVPLGEVRDRLQIPGMGGEIANRFRDKGLMKSILRDAGLPTAKHCRANSVMDALAFADQQGFPLIVKPVDGAGAQGTFRCDDRQRLISCLEYLKPQPAAPIVLEEFVLGREHSFDSVCIDGKVVWSSISHYFPGPLEVIQQSWIQWAVLIPREPEHSHYHPIEQVMPRALEALGMKTGLSHAEWFLRTDGTVAISEVGARPPGAQFSTLISYAHDFNLYRAWARLMIHDQFDPPARKFAVGAAYLRGMGQGHVKQIAGLEQIHDEINEFVVEARFPQIGQAAAEGYEGDGYIIVRHPQTDRVKWMLQQIISNVQIKLE